MNKEKFWDIDFRYVLIAFIIPMLIQLLTAIGQAQNILEWG